MEIWNAINAIKSKAVLKSLLSDLEADHIAAAGPKSCGPQMAAKNAADNYKKDGVAYLKNVCLSHANGIVHHASVKTHFLPPSEETLAWGGFMGGENLVWTDAQDADTATQIILNKIKNTCT